MKNTRLELLRRLQRQYHQHHPWRLSQGGLYVPHSYAEMTPESLSWWDDVGFILNGRRIIVWWQHPRYVYANAIEEQAWQEAGPGPQDNWLTEGATKNYRKVGRSRKKLVSYTCRKPSAQQRQHYDVLRDIENRLKADGIDFDVTPSWKWERLSWAMGVSLVAPMEVRNADEVAVLASLARRLVLGQTTLAAEFPGYRFGRADWLLEHNNKAA
ncbi:MAG: hypothetical protein AUJ20_08585 [Comamonadaceae bacterium CG1_02_60_18]|nr:MAG: hypothetical protein AUJ20_08585 [Comamonadaceae bacterium CG1_02_60_18]PIQ51552.1 MAG: hypothetical protein COW02_13955 [Comamonadaceae bacterium CG12_big_fil_rev_8_21_14_0_65_59_15]